MKKRIFSMVLCICLLAGLLVTAAAAAVMPRWTNVDKADPQITFSGSNAYCTGIVRGKADTTKITATHTLYQVNSNGSTTVVKEFAPQTVSGSTLNFSGTASGVTRGSTYRLQVYVSCTRNGMTESFYTSIDKTY